MGPNFTYYADPGGAQLQWLRPQPSVVLEMAGLPTGEMEPGDMRRQEKSPYLSDQEN